VENSTNMAKIKLLKLAKNYLGSYLIKHPTWKHHLTGSEAEPIFSGRKSKLLYR
jgi:hypothetical protein